ncbi:MAG: ABC transporter ATP-binding protein [Chloroflexota bacterium]
MTGGVGGSVIEVEGVSFSYGSTLALDGLSIEVPRGISFGLVGPNGAGKSTLIRLMVGLIGPQRGRVRVLGEPPRKVTGLVGYMPQLSALYNELSVWENVDFFARIYGLSQRGKRMECVEECVRLVGLWERRRDQILKLSGGMRQRVSLACGMVHRPRLLVLDEPTVGLDPELRVAFWEHFRKLTSEGVTLVVSSHTMDDAAHCDRLAFLRAGRVVAEGAPNELVASTGLAGATLEEAFLYFLRRGGAGG